MKNYMKGLILCKEIQFFRWNDFFIFDRFFKKTGQKENSVNNVACLFFSFSSLLFFGNRTKGYSQFPNSKGEGEGVGKQRFWENLPPISI